MHTLLIDNPGEKMLMLGNEAIARGAIKAGVAFATTLALQAGSVLTVNMVMLGGLVQTGEIPLV
jgi:indolepyruvate ferredoxin oxidoreductase alpha subunit